MKDEKLRMSKALILIINLYQSFISGVIKNILGLDRICRFSPTCSEYAKTAINRDGIFHGLRKTAIRILSCQPLF